MNVQPGILVFDVGKTNKKIIVYDEMYNVLFEESQQLPEISDEDGYPSEDLEALTVWLKQESVRLYNDDRFNIIATNFSAYGASFVHMDNTGTPFLPLYNYLKPFSPPLLERFYNEYGPSQQIAIETASPALGNLNSGLQLYQLLHNRRDVFENIYYSLHLPQYLAYSFHHHYFSDITSIGCHTMLWDFAANDYHKWVRKEKIDSKLAPVNTSGKIISSNTGNLLIGNGLHDSSSALIPYLAAVKEQFILLSTGTWCIAMNPFDQSPLTSFHLDHDCLCYLTHEGKQVKASRLFAGKEFEEQTKRIASHFNTKPGCFDQMSWSSDVEMQVRKITWDYYYHKDSPIPEFSDFTKRDIEGFTNYEQAYSQLMIDMVAMQVKSINLIKTTSVKKLFVDGGFSRNRYFMKLLSFAFPDLDIFSAMVPQASALGAALAIHDKWNKLPLPMELVNLIKV